MEIKQAILTKNKFSRPGTPLKEVCGVVLHWVANPNTSAQANRNYFENLKNQNPNEKTLRYASAHFIVGLQGEILQCLPDNEVGYHVGANKYTDFAIKKFGTNPNNCTIGIELCHGDLTGKFNDDTLAAARELILHLLYKFGLDMPDVCRHFDITGKDCPLYFVKHEDEWCKFIDTI